MPICSNWYWYKLLPYYQKRVGTTVVQANPRQPVAPPSQPAARAVNYTPRQSRTIAGTRRSNTTAARTADEILGLSRPPTTTASLDDEINRYLSDQQTGTSSIAYWQVSFFLLADVESQFDLLALIGEPTEIPNPILSGA